MMSATISVPGWDLSASPFHDGEIAIQERLGVRAKIEAQGRRAVRRFMPRQHRDFYAQLPHVFLASVDDSGQPWASMLMGAPGFLSTPDETSLRIAALPLPGDPLALTLHDGAELAAIGVEFPTRRRNRVIGTAEAVGAVGFGIRVRQTMGLCQKYIQARAPEAAPAAPQTRTVIDGTTLDDDAKALIRRADTFFIASVDPRREDGPAFGADISHRGGRPGFVRVDDETTLTAPDFIGNFIFNTLGNFALEPRAGLLFIDFEQGQLLHLAARAEVIWDGPEVEAFTGAQRLMRFSIDRAIRITNALPVRFSPPAFSPALERTGTWREAAGA